MPKPGPVARIFSPDCVTYAPVVAASPALLFPDTVSKVIHCQGRRAAAKPSCSLKDSREGCQEGKF